MIINDHKIFEDMYISTITYLIFYKVTDNVVPDILPK